MKRMERLSARDHLFRAWELLDFDDVALITACRKMVLEAMEEDLAAAPREQPVHARPFSKNRRR